MAEEVKDKGANGMGEAEITFKCKSCGEMKPLGEMTIAIWLFPRVLVCRACENKLR